MQCPNCQQTFQEQRTLMNQDNEPVKIGKCPGCGATLRKVQDTEKSRVVEDDNGVKRNVLLNE